MGLAIVVDVLGGLKDDPEGHAAARAELDRLGERLEAKGLPPWREPETVSVRPRAHVDSFSYSTIHFLRRALAWTRASEAPLEPTGGELTPDDDALVRDEAAMLDSHLICHSDADGWYVPIPMGEPVFLGDEIAGRVVGSSVCLLDELAEVAPPLGVALTDDLELTDAEAERLFRVTDDDPFARELMAFLTLWECARVSVASGCAIRFI